MIASFADKEGGMVYPAIAEHLVFEKGLTFTWLGIVAPPFKSSFIKLSELLVFAIVAGVTLGLANCVVRQRSKDNDSNSNDNNSSAEMDWTMFHDVPFLLMSASEFILSIQTQNHSSSQTMTKSTHILYLPFFKKHTHTKPIPNSTHTKLTQVSSSPSGASTSASTS